MLLGLFAAQLTYAQTPVFVGVKGGISVPNLTSGSSKSDWDEGYSSRIGPNIGILIERPFSKSFSLQAEVNYIGEGGKRNGIQPFSIPKEYVPLFQQAFQTDKDYVYADFKNVSRINYIQVPVMARFNVAVNASGRLKCFAQAGPYVAFLVGAKQIIKTDDLKVYLDKEGRQQIPPELVKGFLGSSLDTTVDAKEQLHKANLGVQGSVGVSLDCGSGKFFLEAGGNYGFIPIQKGDEHGKNNIGAATVAIGYALKLEKD